MYQSEALWTNFSGSYPCAIKVAAGKISAVSGEPWGNGLSEDPQDYVVVPEQPWLDGFNVAEDYIRQFVSMALGDCFTAEEPITGKGKHGGIQIVTYPMKHDMYLEHFDRSSNTDMDYLDTPTFLRRVACMSEEPDMGLAPGGLMRQEIYEDEQLEEVLEHLADGLWSETG